VYSLFVDVIAAALIWRNRVRQPLTAKDLPTGWPKNLAHFLYAL